MSWDLALGLRIQPVGQLYVAIPLAASEVTFTFIPLISQFPVGFGGSGHIPTISEVKNSVLKRLDYVYNILSVHC